MLTTLRKGVKGGRWYSLSDKVWHLQTLEQAWERARRNHGSRGTDGQTIADFERHKDSHLRRLHEQLKAGTYVPQAIRGTTIPKPGSTERRPLGIPTVKDRVVQGAIKAVIEPIYEHRFAEHSYGFRPGRSCHDALRRVMELLDSGYSWVVDADLKSYFDTIPHERLMALLREDIADQTLLGWLAAYLKQKIIGELREWTPVKGTPQGAVISPLLANLYLDGLDHEMARQGYQMVRYADDFVILCRTAEEAHEALSRVRAWVEQAELTLHPEKTRIVSHETDGFDFLGYHFRGGHRWPREKSLKKFKDRIRELTPRRAGDSLNAIIGKLNGVLRGWLGYFKYCDHQQFAKLDGWIRRRLRSLLNFWHGIRRWKYTRSDHTRYPDAYFHSRGLYSLHANCLLALSTR